MYKNIALLALLLPFSGYAITKQERKQKQERQNEIVKEVLQIESEMIYLQDMIKHNAWLLFVSGETIRKSATEAREKILALNVEYYKLESELS